VAIQSGHHQVHTISDNSRIVQETIALLKPEDILITIGAEHLAIWQRNSERTQEKFDTNSKV
jgi:hypothetical protein